MYGSGCSTPEMSMMIVIYWLSSSSLASVVVVVVRFLFFRRLLCRLPFTVILKKKIVAYYNVLCGLCLCRQPNYI